ncbi:hypothetical protein ACFLRT_02670 [Acidobacteriota bacterium]
MEAQKMDDQKGKEFIGKNEILAIGLLIFLTIIIFSPILNNIIIKKPLVGYRFHIQFAQQVASGEKRLDSSTHFLYQLLVVLTWVLIPGSNFYVSGFVVILICFIFTSIIIYMVIRPSPGDISSFRDKTPYVWLTLAAIIVTPITLFFWDGTLPSLRLGYIINSNDYNNPTNLLLKPLALLLFFYAVKIFNDQLGSRIKKGVVISAVCITVLSTIAKPSYIICLLPALGLMVLIRLFRKQPINWLLMIVGIVLPAVVILIWQFFLRFSGDPNSIAIQANIVFAPFAVISAKSSQLFPKFILSILFPLSVYILYFKYSKKNLYLNLAWLSFLVGTFYAYFLAEAGGTGRISLAGNFFWCAQITSFILFVVSLRFFLKTGSKIKILKVKEKSNGRFTFCAVIFSLHLISSFILMGSYL